MCLAFYRIISKSKQILTRINRLKGLSFPNLFETASIDEPNAVDVPDADPTDEAVATNIPEAKLNPFDEAIAENVETPTPETVDVPEAEPTA